METFKIEVQELLARVVEVQAENLEEAFTVVNDQYKKEEIVLDYDDFVQVDFIDANSQSQKDEVNMLVIDVINYLYSEELKHFEELDKPENHIFRKLERLKLLID